MNESPDIALERKKAAQRIKSAYHRLFSSEDGRIVLDDMEKLFGLKSAVFVPVKVGNDVYAYDPLTAAQADGGRKVLIHIHGILSQPLQADGDISEKKKPTIKKK